MKFIETVQSFRGLFVFLFLTNLFISCQPDKEEEQVIPNYSQPFLGAWKVKKKFSTYTINIANDPGITNAIIITNLDEKGVNTLARVDGSTFVINEQSFGNEFIGGTGSIRKDTITVIFNTRFTLSSTFPTSYTAIGVR